MKPKFGPSNRAMRQFGVLAAINAFIFFVMVSVVVLVPPALYDLYQLVRAQTRDTTDPRALLPNYTHLSWAKTFFNEFWGLKYSYFDYIVWSPRPFEGVTVHVDKNGFRRNMLPTDVGIGAAQAWFFGGSTMWGFGAKDDGTIPAEFAKTSGLTTFNFAEPAYVTHQSLNLLMKAYLAGGHPKYVAFYDGFNNVDQACRTDQTPYSSAQENLIRGYVDAGSRRLTGNQFADVFLPTIRVFKMIGMKLSKKPQSAFFYDCATNARKARQVAETMVSDWTTAKMLAEAHGAKFVAVLQPVAYFGSPNLAYLPDVTREVTVRRQFEAVYPELRKILNERHIPYLDLTGVFDGKELIYIDSCHVSPNGNRKVAQALLSAFH